jgi:hypothetical protein
VAGSGRITVRILIYIAAPLMALICWRRRPRKMSRREMKYRAELLMQAGFADAESN